jgi:putative multicomponent Na+:H+ antiporter subunit B
MFWLTVPLLAEKKRMPSAIVMDIITTNSLITDNYIYVIVALLPLVAGMLIFQVNPYHALVIRGILGAVAAMTYSILGAADVALTEALMGTLLAITLYAIAVRSSLVMRLGVIEDDTTKAADNREFKKLIIELRKVFLKHYMGVELVNYPNAQALQRAMVDKEIHGACVHQSKPEKGQSYYIVNRLQRLYDIMESELSPEGKNLAQITLNDFGNIPESSPTLELVTPLNIGERYP